MKGGSHGTRLRHLEEDILLQPTQHCMCWILESGAENEFIAWSLEGWMMQRIQTSARTPPGKICDVACSRWQLADG